MSHGNSMASETFRKNNEEEGVMEEGFESICSHFPNLYGYFLETSELSSIDCVDKGICSDKIG